MATSMTLAMHDLDEARKKVASAIEDHPAASHVLGMAQGDILKAMQTCLKIWYLDQQMQTGAREQADGTP